MLKIVQIADIHFGAEDPVAIEIFDKMLPTLGADLLAVCGDLTQHGSEIQFEAAASWLNSHAISKIIVPGNHDTPMWNMAKRLTKPFNTFKTLFAEDAQPQTHANHFICGINTARGAQLRRNWAEGSVKLEQLESLVSPSPNARFEHGILIAHHPFLPPQHSYMRTRTSRGLRASHILAESKVDMLLCGHIHTPGVELIQHGDGRYLCVSASTLSTRLRQHPPGFNLIEIDDLSITISYIALDPAGVKRGLMGMWDAKTLEPLGTRHFVPA